jgi:hypothetical protein
MTETIPVYIKGTDKVLQAEPAPGKLLIILSISVGFFSQQHQQFLLFAS